MESLITHLTLLGIVIDTPTMMLSISKEHKQDLISSLKLLLYHSKCIKHELLSLIGKLSLTCRIFLCWLIDTSCSVLLLHHYTKRRAHLDICLWLQFLPQWNDLCCILQTIWTAAPAMGFSTNMLPALLGCLLVWKVDTVTVAS